jgi:hypothetical protein
VKIGISEENTMPKPTGRPSLYTEELADEICLRMAEGESLRAICAEAGKPNFSTVMQWVIEDRGGFHAMYRRAREVQAHNLAERALEIAFTATDAQKGRLAFDALR